MTSKLSMWTFLPDCLAGCQERGERGSSPVFDCQIFSSWGKADHRYVQMWNLEPAFGAAVPRGPLPSPFTTQLMTWWQAAGEPQPSADQALGPLTLPCHLTLLLLHSPIRSQEACSSRPLSKVSPSTVSVTCGQLLSRSRWSSFERIVRRSIAA